MSKRTKKPGRVLVFGVAALALTTSCFYDSRWGESKRLQEAAAKRATPRALQPTGGEEGAARLRVMRIHAYASPRYTAEVVDWRRQLEALIDDANRLLGPTLSIRLEVATAATWAERSDGQGLGDQLTELRSQDDGSGADWVVGLVGSVPRAEVSFHQLGLSNRPGKHIVMRAMSDATELDAIQKNLKELNDAARQELYTARKRHKVTTVFLHEIGHTLGVIHERDAAAILSPRYSSDAERFSPEATEWMRATLRDRLGTTTPGEPALAETVLGLLARSPEVWVTSERDELLQQMQLAMVQSPPPPAATAKSAPVPLPSATAPGTAADRHAESPPGGGQPAGIAAADAALFAQALADEKAGKQASAEKLARPLFTRYPDSYEVQDLRCRLAMSLHAEDWDKAQAECALFMKLGSVPRKE